MSLLCLNYRTYAVTSEILIINQKNSIDCIVHYNLFKIASLLYACCLLARVSVGRVALREKRKLLCAQTLCKSTSILM